MPRLSLWRAKAIVAASSQSHNSPMVIIPAVPLAQVNHKVTKSTKYIDRNVFTAENAEDAEKNNLSLRDLRALRGK